MRPLAEGVAGAGTVVEVRFDGDKEIERFLIGSREESETASVQVYSAASPLGVALTGAREGETVEYEEIEGTKGLSAKDVRRTASVDAKPKAPTK